MKGFFSVSTTSWNEWGEACKALCCDREVLSSHIPALLENDLNFKPCLQFHAIQVTTDSLAKRKGRQMLKHRCCGSKSSLVGSLCCGVIPTECKHHRLDCELCQEERNLPICPLVPRALPGKVPCSCFLSILQMPGMVLGTEDTAGSRDTKVSIFTVLPSQSCG